MKNSVQTWVLVCFVLLSASCSVAGVASRPNADHSALGVAENVLHALANEDYVTLSTYVHETKGLNFSPYSRDLAELSILNFSKDDVASLMENETVYSWGRYDGSGTSIDLTPPAYHQSFIYDFPYKEQAVAIEVMSNNPRLSPELNAVNRQYPHANIVMYRFEGTESAAFNDARDLLLIFTNSRGSWFLEGIAHAENTI